MLLDLAAPAAAAIIAIGAVIRTLIITLVGAHLVKTTDDPKVLDRYAKVVKAMRMRWRFWR